MKKSLGVNSIKSETSELTGLSGLLFKICSTRHIVVAKASSVTELVPRTAYIAFLQLCTTNSLTPPKCGAAGGLNFQVISS